MKASKMIWILPLMGILAAPVAAHDRYSEHRHYDRIEKRLDRQHHRIKRGVRSGELTWREAKRLHKQQRRIARLKRRFLDDGYLDHHEHNRLLRKLDRASDRIYRLKHNDRYRERGAVVGHGDHHRGGQGRYGGYGTSHWPNDPGWGFVLRLSDHF